MLRQHISYKMFGLLVVVILLGIGAIVVSRAYAFPWGGRFNVVTPCWDGGIFTSVGGPRGGIFLWEPGITQTYQFGPPRRSGQYGLGLAGPPYFCIISPYPIIVLPGIIMTMLGTSK